MSFIIVEMICCIQKYVKICLIKALLNINRIRWLYLIFWGEKKQVASLPRKSDEIHKMFDKSQTYAHEHEIKQKWLRFGMSTTWVLSSITMYVVFEWHFDESILRTIFVDIRFVGKCQCHSQRIPRRETFLLRFYFSNFSVPLVAWMRRGGGAKGEWNRHYVHLIECFGQNLFILAVCQSYCRSAMEACGYFVCSNEHKIDNSLMNMDGFNHRLFFFSVNFD